MKTLLIIDDEPAIRMLLKQYFMKKFNVEEIHDGTLAIQWLTANTDQPVIILDLNMPKVGGLEVISAVRNSTHHSRAPIIILSSKESSADRIKCLRAGADDYVVKPFNPEELDARIEAILRRI